MKYIDIIIVHYGDINTTKKALESIEKYAKYRSVVIVNNDPNITIAQKIDKSHRRVLIDSNKNVGFAAGVNIGIKHAIKNDADYVVLFNNDAVAHNDFLLPLIENSLEDKSVGILSPVIKFKKGGETLYDKGGKINPLTGKTYHVNSKNPPSGSTNQVDFVSGCCMMIRSDVINKIGEFDESFFMYYEDVDFCLRARKAGFKISSVSKSLIEHDLSKTIGANSNTAIYHLIRSGNTFGKKYHKEYPLNIVFRIYQSLVFFIRSPFSLVSILKGWL